MAAISKIDKLQYVCNALTDRKNISRGHAYRSSPTYWPLKCPNFKNPRRRTADVLKIEKKSPSVTLRPIAAKFDMVTHIAPEQYRQLRFRILGNQNGGQPLFMVALCNRADHYIFAL